MAPHFLARSLPSLEVITLKSDRIQIAKQFYNNVSFELIEVLPV